MKAADALAAHDQRLIELLRAGIEHSRLRELMHARGEWVQSLVAALGGGEKLSAEEIGWLQQQERQLHEALAQRRDRVADELTLLHRARRAGRSYCGEAARAAKFVDRAG